MATQAALGKKALTESKFEEAIKQYTLALKQSPTSPDYLIQRATAYTRAKKYTEALADANNAVINAQKRAKKELIIEAQFRRGVAYYSLERYGDAEFLFGVVKRLDGPPKMVEVAGAKRLEQKHKMVEMWANKTKMALAKETDEGKKVKRIEEMPSEEELAGGMTSAGIRQSQSDSGNGVFTSNGTAPTNGAASATNGSAATAPTTASTQAAQTPPDKIRHEWYQNTTNVYFTLLAKGVPKEKAQIDISARSVSISFPLLTESSYDLTLDPLFAEVKPAECITRVLPNKIEIILVKATPGQKWSALESNEPLENVAKTCNSDTTEGILKAALLANAQPKAPSYPTSSKHGPKDWDKAVKEASASLKDPSAKPGAAEDDDDYEGGDEANHFFKKLFKGASPEAQKAMMKSYTESNGTALSTNWDEVSKAPVKTEPPEGMEAKNWGS